MSANHPLSQRTFDRIIDEIYTVKDYAERRNDWKLWNTADRIDAFVHKFVSDLIVEGSVPDPGSPKS